MVRPQTPDHAAGESFHSRVVIEQANGVFFYGGDFDMPAAFAALRSYARGRDIKLTELAYAVVNRALPAELVFDHVGTGGAGVG